LPLYTALKILQALAVGAQAVELPLSPAATDLLAIAKFFVQPVAVTTPLETEIVELLHAFRRLPRERRKAVVRLVEAANDLFGRDFTKGMDDENTGALGTASAAWLRADLPET
jgi:hypothetical protein